MCKELPFEPFPFIKGSHKQTIIGFIFNFAFDPKSVTKFVPLSDGDAIALEITMPDEWREDKLTVVMLHGLCGSHKSSYLVRMTKKLSKKGICCIRMNLRGCGSGFGHAKNIYHSGRSNDLFEVLEFLEKENPGSLFVIMGFSLGANIVLKFAGEMNNKADGWVKQVISISPPADLLPSVNLIHSRYNQFYEKYFLRLLKSDVRKRERYFPDVPHVEFPRHMNFMDFDELYTAPQCGFEGALDYYKKCSSKPLISEITVDTRILFSEDDPIIQSNMLDDLTLPENIEIYKTKKGGHLGYLSLPKKHGFHWMDHVLEEWILEP